jgi:hypothetical protein
LINEEASKLIIEAENINNGFYAICGIDGTRE